MSQSFDEQSPPTLPDHGLPPVEPPNARFIVQLFVVPGAIVTIIVLVWLLFNWLAQMGADPSKYVKVLASNSKARWQAAASLADVLNDARNAPLKHDHELAGQLADLLADELKKPTTDSEQENLEVFLCSALGKFEVAEAVPPLVEAARRTGPENLVVRNAALSALAVLASTLPRDDNPLQAEMDAALHEAASDAESQIRCVAAFALGVEGTEAANERLTEMLADIYPDVRYNAAVGLARHGNAAGYDVILEMLDPSEQARRAAAAKSESKDDSKPSETGDSKLVHISGLQAAERIYKALSPSQQQTIRTAVERLRDEKDHAEVRLKAVETLKRLDAIGGGLA